MNVLIILLILVIIVVVIYFIYRSLKTSNYLISAIQDLNSSPKVISVSNLADPSSTRYAYSVWVYVKSWNNSNNKVIISRYNDIVLYLDKTTATLRCKMNPKYFQDKATATPVEPSSVTNDDTSSPFINITNNFPLQKWVNIIISMDNTVFDAYLDGKLVKSLQITQVNPDKTSDLYTGTGYDAYLTRLKRFDHPLDPQTAWQTYLKGNGNGSVFGNYGKIPNYGADLTIYEDNVVSKNIKLL